jgi:hypothetical protein
MQKQNAKAASPTDSFLPKIPPFKGDRTNKNNLPANNSVPKNKSSMTNNSMKGKHSPTDNGAALSPACKNGKDKSTSGAPATDSVDSAQGSDLNLEMSQADSPKNKESSSLKDTSPASKTTEP